MFSYFNLKRPSDFGKNGTPPESGKSTPVNHPPTNQPAVVQPPFESNQQAASQSYSQAVGSQPSNQYLNQNAVRYPQELSNGGPPAAAGQQRGPGSNGIEGEPPWATGAGNIITRAVKSSPHLMPLAAQQSTGIKIPIDMNIIYIYLIIIISDIYIIW